MSPIMSKARSPGPPQRSSRQAAQRRAGRGSSANRRAERHGDHARSGGVRSSRARSAEPSVAQSLADISAGIALRWASAVGTAVFSVTAIAAAVAPSTLEALSFVVSVALFASGMVIFFWAYGLALARSRTDEIAVSSLFLLAGSAPSRVRWQLLGSLAVEVVVAAITAGVRPFSPLAAGVLVPLYALALCGLWAARYGSFPPRVVPGRRLG